MNSLLITFTHDDIFVSPVLEILSVGLILDRPNI